MRNKKAMSEIVTTVIMVVLALVAVAVIWQIINNLISDKGAQIGVTQKCLDVKLSVEKVLCTGDTCAITIKRAAGGDAFNGVKIVLKSDAGSSDVINSNSEDISPAVSNIEELASKTLTVTPAGIVVADANKVEVTAYFVDDAGLVQNCPSTATYNFNQA